MVDIVIDAGVIIGKGIAVVEVVNEDYLMVVEVMEENYSMNIYARFGTHHRQNLNHQIWEIASWFLGPEYPWLTQEYQVSL